jgi:hypothetical protein
LRRAAGLIGNDERLQPGFLPWPAKRWINHAILTEAEFTQAVPRLLSAGPIGARPEADRYWHTEAGRALYRQRMKRCGLFGWIEAIPPALRWLGELQDTAWSLLAGVFDHAVQEWHQGQRDPETTRGSGVRRRARPR